MTPIEIRAAEKRLANLCAEKTIEPPMIDQLLALDNAPAHQSGRRGPLKRKHRRLGWIWL